MLHVYLGREIFNDKRFIAAPQVFFNNVYEEEWITSDFGKAIIKDIDDSEVAGPYNIISPIFGSILTEKIAGGTKTLFLMKYDDYHVFNGSACGDNCSKWILEIAKEKELYIRLGHMMRFDKYTDDNFDMMIEETGVIVHNTRDFIDEYIEVVHG